MTGPGTAPATSAGDDVRAGVTVAVALAVVGALLGLVWMAWSPDRPPARITPAGRLQAESEQWIAADGRFLVIAAVVGLGSGLLAWTRRRHRGPAMLVALAAGNLAGAGLMWLVGWATGGGSDHGPASGDTGFVAVTRLSLHLPALVFLQAGLAVLAYGVLVSFTGHDDLGRPDPTRDAAHAAKTAWDARFVPVPVPPPPPGQPPYPAPPGFPPSVAAGGHPDDGGRDGDAAGPLQQRDLPPQ